MDRSCARGSSARPGGVRAILASRLMRSSIESLELSIESARPLCEEDLHGPLRVGHRASDLDGDAFASVVSIRSRKNAHDRPLDWIRGGARVSQRECEAR